MATRAVQVRKSFNQEDLRTHPEHCSADGRALSAVGITGCQQVRVKRTDNENEYALYTVSEVRIEDTDDIVIVRMGQLGRRRLGPDVEFDDEFGAEFNSQVVHPTMSDREAKENGEFVERLQDHCAHSGLIVIAPHGGHIEAHTDAQARGVASSLAADGKAVSFWLCKGYQGPLRSAYDAWHITSVDIDPASFPLLNSVFSRRFSHAVAFHGFGPGEEEAGDDEVDVLVGGGQAAADLKELIALTIATEVANIAVRVAGPDDLFNGDDPSNIVNRLTIGGRNGVQIEQSQLARESHGDKIAEAVADVYRSRL
jgi:phage replication-related protein YjqB (UPF0714/DUF867 family)